MNEKEKKKRDEVIIALPSYTNQLLLLLDSGVILKDAMTRISRAYLNTPKYEEDYFKREIATIYLDSEKSGENIVNLFYLFTRKSGVKELMRMGSILRDNMDKGSVISEKLETLSDELWKERKRHAEECVKKADTKLSFPLALMLISLIILTIAPCMIGTN